MPLPKRMTAYPLEKKIFDKVLELNQPLVYTLKTKGHAVAFRQRLYAFRRLAAEANVVMYDRCIIRQDDNRVIIDPAPKAIILETLNGDIISVDPGEAKEFSDPRLEAQISSFRDELGLEDEG